MKRKTFYFTIIIFIFIFFNTFAESFNSENIYNTIKILSSDKYRGRLAGDKGNYLAAQYIANCFKKIGLDPLGDNGTFYQGFELIVPLLNGECSFKVLDTNGNIVKKYEYGKDFKELIYGASVSGEIIGKIKLMDKPGTIAIVEKGYSENSYQYNEDLMLKKSGIKAVIYPTNMDFRFRSPYKLQKLYNDGLIKIMVSKNLINEIIRYSSLGYNFEIKSPVQIKKVTVQNVIGMIKGKDESLPPVILSAHFDHVGFDADNIIYPGAFDNASGTALLIEFARILKSLKDNKRTIIFAAFNGEEEGLLGSKYFVEHCPIDIKGAQCINFDMVGSKDKIPLSILSLENSNRFVLDIYKIISPLSKVEIIYNDNSDHASFCKIGVDSVTLIHDNISKIHTPKDTIENVDIDRIKEVYDVAEAFLKSKDVIMVSAQSNNQYFLYRKVIIILGAIILSLSFILYFKRRNL
ncbi:Zn-dependent exopeptidase M28 [Caloramator sp. E03]|uniref:M28 family metallopeptidase n=1 Tax=Caloramator sp. E03 TaxID=2576307 RepID=UPI00111082F7|nr:M28 family metallopeptidase [Caloramator sp. E03]QCX33932.1 Zn-dependent exopeptidase M28 [Caloramator sp. E03]